MIFFLWLATLTLAWDAVPGATAYRLRCTLTRGPVTVVSVAPQVTLRLPGEACCTVQALRGAQAGPQSERLCLTSVSLRGRCLAYTWESQEGQKVGFCAKEGAQ